MKTIRLCIGSNDDTTVANTHMGDTHTFHIYDISENGESTFIEKRTNAVQNMDHDNTDKMKRIINILKDSNVFLARKRSPNFLKIAKTTQYQPVIVNSDTIEDSLILVGKAFQKIYTYVEKRKNGEFFDTIPELS